MNHGYSLVVLVTKLGLGVRIRVRKDDGTWADRSMVFRKCPKLFSFGFPAKIPEAKICNRQIHLSSFSQLGILLHQYLSAFTEVVERIHSGAQLLHQLLHRGTKSNDACYKKIKAISMHIFEPLQVLAAFCTRTFSYLRPIIVKKIGSHFLKDTPMC
jgi:hypothetical protein